MALRHFLLLALSVLSLNVIASPHAARSLHSHHHRHIAARVAAPAVAPLRKRATSRRCRPRSSAVPSPTSTSKPVVTQPVANAAPAPDVEPRPTTTSRAAAPPPPPPAPPKEDPPKTTAKPDPPAPKPTPTPKPAPPPPSNNNGGGGGARPFGDFFAGIQTGQGTFYDTGLTACGETNKDSDMIAAISQHMFDAVPGAGPNPNKNPICGQRVRATYKGKSVTVRITDRCTGCKSTDLDFSPAAFNQLADPSLGRISGVQWEFVN